MDRITRIANNAQVSEKAIEKYLVSRVKAMGGVCLKYTNPGQTGYPDRVALLPSGKTIWFELKSKGRKPSKIQTLTFAEMERIGHHVHVCDSREAIDEILNNQ